jgi:dTDP-4-dehydrorhamnose reductase
VRKLLVTGVSGYLGSALATRAGDQGWDVVDTFLTREPDPATGARAIRLDVTDAGAVGALLHAEMPDAVIHTAYLQRGERARTVNEDGAAHVAVAARACRARLIHLSSDVVFAGDVTRPLQEDDPVGPVSDYGAAKAAAEAAVGLADPDALIVRTSLLYGGPGCAPSRHEELALAAARGDDDIVFFEDEVRCPIQVGDLAAALVELLESARAGLLHVAGADAVDRLTFARLVVSARGEDPAGLAGGPAPRGRPGVVVLDSSRAQALLTTRLRGVREVLGRDR